jgi:uncharacterized membrane protein
MNNPALKDKKSLKKPNEDSYMSPINTSLGYYQGPIPPPNFLAEYEKIVPGIAKTKNYIA